MSTDIIQCDSCGMVVRQYDSHGWFDVRILVTKPNEDEFDAAMQNPVGRLQIKAHDIQPAHRPAMVGGDFCSMKCLLKYYTEQEGVRSALESPPAPPKEAPDAS